MTRDHAFNVIFNEIRDQEEAIGGPPSRTGMAWALVNALTTAGFDLGGDDFRDLEKRIEASLDLEARVAANLEDFRS